jgi:hypothetical protein
MHVQKEQYVLKEINESIHNDATSMANNVKSNPIE